MKLENVVGRAKYSKIIVTPRRQPAPTLKTHLPLATLLIAVFFVTTSPTFAQQTFEDCVDRANRDFTSVEKLKADLAKCAAKSDAVGGEFINSPPNPETLKLLRDE